jgi:hypothetical protein
MKGNSAIIKCSIPSFVADFVHVVGWTDEEGKEYLNEPKQKDGTIRYKKYKLQVPLYLSF